MKKKLKLKPALPHNEFCEEANIEETKMKEAQRNGFLKEAMQHLENLDRIVLARVKIYLHNKKQNGK